MQSPETYNSYKNNGTATRANTKPDKQWGPNLDKSVTVDCHRRTGETYKNNRRTTGCRARSPVLPDHLRSLRVLRLHGWVLLGPHGTRLQLSFGFLVHESNHWPHDHVGCTGDGPGSTLGGMLERLRTTIRTRSSEPCSSVSLDHQKTTVKTTDQWDGGDTNFYCVRRRVPVFLGSAPPDSPPPATKLLGSGRLFVCCLRVSPCAILLDRMPLYRSMPCLALGRDYAW